MGQIYSKKASCLTRIFNSFTNITIAGYKTEFQFPKEVQTAKDQTRLGQFSLRIGFVL